MQTVIATHVKMVTLHGGSWSAWTAKTSRCSAAKEMQQSVITAEASMPCRTITVQLPAAAVHGAQDEAPEDAKLPAVHCWQEEAPEEEKLPALQG